MSPADTVPMVTGNVSVADLVNVLVQVGIPMVVALVTKGSTSNAVKWTILSVLTGLNCALLAWAPGTTIPSLLLSGAFGFIVSLGAHHGIYVPTGVTQKLQSMLVKDKPDYQDQLQDEQEALIDEELEEASEEPVEALEGDELPPCPVKHKAGSKAALRCLEDPMSCPGRKALV